MTLKFRAWRNNKMYDVQTISWTNRGIYVTLVTGIHSGTRHGIQRVNLMKSTGIKDKNGTEIFEKDIIRWRDLETFDDFKIDEPVRIEYSNELLRWITVDIDGNIDELHDFTNDRDLEIIGNSYENPELLGGIIE